MNQKINYNKKDPEYSPSEEDFNLREIIFNYLSYWKWFVLSVALCLGVGAFTYLCLDRKYVVKSAILLKEDQGSGNRSGSPIGQLQDLGLLSTTHNIDNEISVLSSPNLLKQVIDSLDLHVSYYEIGLFRDKEIYKSTPYIVALTGISSRELAGGINLKIQKGNDGYTITGKYTIKKDSYSFSEKVNKLPALVAIPNLKGAVTVSLNENVSEKERENIRWEEDIKVTITNVIAESQNIEGSLHIAPTTKQSSVLNVSLSVLNTRKGADILNALVDIYNRNNIRENNEMARNTSDFIDARLIDITRELKTVEGGAVAYKKTEGITNIEKEAEVTIQLGQDIEKHRTTIEIQLKTIELVESFVKDNPSDYRMIPTLGVTDGGLVRVINEYNTLVLNYDKIVRSVSEESPSRINAIAQLENTKMGILQSIDNVKRAINVDLKEVNKQSAEVSSKIRSIPTQSQELLEIMREQEVKQALYLYLMQIKEETNVTMASTADKAKVITDPLLPAGPVSPKKAIIFLIALAIGLLLPIIGIFIKDQLEVNITGREDLENLSSINIIGEIVKNDSDDGNTLVVYKQKTTPIVELFRTLRNNIKFMLNEDKKVILVTSTIPKEGKTFMSINLAASFAIANKKVLLIGLDIRNPKLMQELNMTRGEGVTSYLAGSTSDWKSLVSTVPTHPNLDVLQAGITPPNPNELLMSPRLGELIEEAKKEYDIVILDTAPVGVVSDTFLLEKYPDITVYVTREGVTPKGAINFVNTMNREDKFSNIYFVLNGVDFKKNKGARKYTYGYGASYGYHNNPTKE